MGNEKDGVTGMLRSSKRRLNFPDVSAHKLAQTCWHQFIVSLTGVLKLELKV